MDCPKAHALHGLSITKGEVDMQAIVDFVRLCIALIECARSCGDEIADDTVTNNTDGLLAALGEHVILRQADEKYPHTYNTTW